MIRSKHLEKLSSSRVPAQAPSRSRLATVDGCSLWSPNHRDTWGISNNTTDITLPSLHLTLTALAAQSVTVTVCPFTVE